LKSVGEVMGIVGSFQEACTKYTVVRNKENGLGADVKGTPIMMTISVTYDSSWDGYLGHYMPYKWGFL